MYHETPILGLDSNRCNPPSPPPPPALITFLLFKHWYKYMLTFPDTHLAVHTVLYLHNTVVANRLRRNRAIS
jgi:hypothetical protein